MKKRRLVLATLVAVPRLVAAGLALADAGGSLEGSKPATARFHDTDAAGSAGYTVTVADTAGHVCIDQQGAGGMGIHLLNPTLLDATVDSTQPEALVYAPADETARSSSRPSSTSCSSRRGTTRTVSMQRRRRSSDIRSCSIRSRIGSAFRRSTRSTRGSGSRIRPGCSSPGTRG
jgi:hypothetical protein